MDFLQPSIRMTKSGIEIYADYLTISSNDLMIRGGDFYAIWDEEAGLWSTSQERAVQLIDKELDEFSKKYPEASVRHLKIARNKEIDTWRHYVRNQLWDNYVDLDAIVNYQDTPPDKFLHASRRLPYTLEDVPTPAYDELISKLYSPEERMKLEWAIGSIFAGDSVDIQKFVVLYGDKGTGKSTVLNIITKLFTTGKAKNGQPEGYFGFFDAKSLGSSNKDFKLEPLKDNPLIGIQQDGDLSKIEDNTTINSLVSHEIMPVNTKHKSIYTNRFHTFLFMGTNRPVKITDSRSGILRRLIDVSPTGEKFNIFKYRSLYKAVDFELGGIAKHCLDIYLNNKNLYDNYTPVKMMGASNDFYNFIQEMYDIYYEKQNVTFRSAWEDYTKHTDTYGLKRMNPRVFREELKNYFNDFKERTTLEDGTRVRSLYMGFKSDTFDTVSQKTLEPDNVFVFAEQESLLDDILKDMPAQYANDDGKPTKAWDNVDTTLKDIDTKQLHYVMVPENHIVIDFDIPDELGNKSLKYNLAEANKFPLTYAELSKSGQGIHLHYLYSGDVSQLSSVYGEHIEVKIFKGKSSLRRKLTKCNNVPIATLTSGLPFKKPKKGDTMLDTKAIQDQRHLENLIRWIMTKPKDFKPYGQEPYTILCCNYIYDTVEKAYNSGIKYDISPMREEIMRFASNSHHSANAAIAKFMSMHWMSDDIQDDANIKDDTELPIAFFDVEVFPNLLIICWKVPKVDDVEVMINPSPSEVEHFVKTHRLIGFNNRRYDNHILYARILGNTNAQIYDISQRIVSGDRNAFFREAYNISYTDIYDFMADKMSLKKLEIEMGINHVELGMDWNEPVPEEEWTRVAGYCANDVKATEAAFEYLNDDWEARKILAKLAGGSVNQSTNSLSTQFIFGSNRDPQSEFNYRNLAEPVGSIDNEMWAFLAECKPDMLNDKGNRYPESWLPFFEGYKYENGQSTYRGEVVGEGGYVYAEPGQHYNVALLDIASMHPNSIVAECLFGPVYTKRFLDILDSRMYVKHEVWEILSKHMDGVFAEFIDDILEGKINPEALAFALKIVINSIYGLTKAHFANAFRDPRNIDNIVAKRGALFMVDLKHEVQKRGYTVAHIKTDSIKIPNADKEIIDFVMDFGKRYGYNFEHEATYERMCLVNDAVYIAKYATNEYCEQQYGYLPTKQKPLKWTATGKQFKVPYVFKTMFDKTSPIDIKDMAETKSSQTALYLDFNENLDEDEHDYRFIGKVGQFTPVKEGFGGGRLLVRSVDKEGNVKYDYAQESKGYRWKETMSIDNLEEIDRCFYSNKVDDAKEAIDNFGSYVDFMEGE